MALSFQRSHLIAILVFQAMVATAVADVVELKTGERIDGRFKGAALDRVSLEVGGQTISFELDKVRAIYFGSAPSQAGVQASPLQEALRALKALDSVVTSGVTYRDYSPRVSDSKIIVDRYLRDPESEPVAKKALNSAIEFYLLAGQAWSARISAPTRMDFALLERVGRNSIITECSKAEEFLDRDSSRKPGEVDPKSPYARGLRLSLGDGGVAVLWSCATEKTAEAERTGGQR